MILRLLVSFLFCVSLSGVLHGCKKNDAKNNPLKLHMPNTQQWSKDIILGGQVRPRDLPILKKAGYKSIVNLRTAREMRWDEKAAVEKLGMRYVHLPISGPQSYTKEAAKRFDSLMKNAANRPMLIHCGSSNRVGGMFAWWSFVVQKKSAKKSLAIGTKAGMGSGLRAAMKARLKK